MTYLMVHALVHVPVPIPAQPILNWLISAPSIPLQRSSSAQPQSTLHACIDIVYVPQDTCHPLLKYRVLMSTVRDRDEQYGTYKHMYAAKARGWPLAPHFLWRMRDGLKAMCTKLAAYRSSEPVGRIAEIMSMDIRCMLRVMQQALRKCRREQRGDPESRGMRVAGESYMVMV